jgi:hypothetical protein
MKELLNARNRLLNEELPLNEKRIYLENLFEEYGTGSEEEKGFIGKTARIVVQYARNEHDEDEFAEFKTEQRNYENALKTKKGVEGHELEKEFQRIMP